MTRTRGRGLGKKRETRAKQIERDKQHNNKQYPAVNKYFPLAAHTIIMFPDSFITLPSCMWVNILHVTWASLAHNYLAIMASSVLRAFSSAGITISKQWNRLKGDIVEALQCLKCMYWKGLDANSYGSYAVVVR